MRIVNHLLLGLVSLVVLTGAVGLLAPTAGWATLQCGDHIGPNASAFLFHDLNCSGSDPALTVEGPATLLMLGHTLDCQDPAAVGIQVIGQAAIVQGGAVTGCEVGVQVGGQGSHLIKEMTATQNIEGFALEDGSHGNTLTANTSRDNILVGFNTPFTVVGQSDDNEVSWNTSKNDGNGYFITGARNTVKSNTAKNYISVGFIIGGPDHMVTQNKALGGGGGTIGFEVRGARITVIQNLAKVNTKFGFFLAEGSEFTVLQNTAKNNNFFGIFLGATDSTVLGNVALDNGTDLGDNDANCDNNQWVGNTFETSFNPGCIH